MNNKKKKIYWLGFLSVGILGLMFKASKTSPPKTVIDLRGMVGFRA